MAYSPTRAGYKAVSQEEAEQTYGYTGAGGAGDSAYLAANSGVPLPGHNQRWVADSGGGAAASSASATAMPGASSGGGDPVGGGAKIVAPEPAAPSMQALQGAGGGDPGMGGGPESLGAPSQFRQGIGKRIYPQESAALASLRKAY